LGCRRDEKNGATTSQNMTAITSLYTGFLKPNASPKTSPARLRRRKCAKKFARGPLTPKALSGMTNNRRLSLRENWKYGTLMTNTSHPSPNSEPITNLPLTDCRPSPKILLHPP
jgi:hypothetical protein